MYKRSDVVLCRVPMPSTGLKYFKLRPAIIVSKDANNRRLADVMVAPCTSNITRHREATQYLIHGPEIAVAGIRVPSVVKCESLLTVPKTLIVCRLGQLSDAGQEAVDRCLCDALGLQHSKG